MQSRDNDYLAASHVNLRTTGCNQILGDVRTGFRTGA